MRRSVTPDERALWRAVTKDVKSRNAQRGNRYPLEISRGKMASGDKVVSSKVVSGRLNAIGEGNSLGHSAPISRPVSSPSPSGRLASYTLRSTKLNPKVSGQVRFDDQSRARKVARGVIPIEARLDLHGFTEVEAFLALSGFLGRACARSFRCVLVITGKGGISHQGDDKARVRGVLRRRLPFWIQTSFHESVSAVSPAHAKHGGNGAFYLFLRKNK